MRKEYIEDLEGEVWIETSGYEISNKGRIITKLGKLFTGNITSFGYVTANVKFDDGFIARSAHRAVAHTFIHNDDPINKIEVNHKDGVKTNNCVENLEWCTKEENQKHEAKFLQQRGGENNYKNILTEEDVLTIYDLCKNSNMKYKDIAKQYGVIPQEINRIASATCWRHLGLEPLPPLVRGSRSRGRKVTWINEGKDYLSMVKCSEDLRNTYNIIVDSKIIGKICNGKLEEYKGQKFKYT
jgi:hypothetical protein